MDASDSPLTAYEILGVHPSAPPDLLGVCYWLVTKELQTRRGEDPQIDRILHNVTRAYETVADPARRGEYDAAIGNTQEPLIKRPLPRRSSAIRRFFRRNGTPLSSDVDPYEVLGLQASALGAAIPEGYRIMRDQYLRLPSESRRRPALLRLLEESYSVLTDPEKRFMIDSKIHAEAERKLEKQASAPESDSELSRSPLTFSATATNDEPATVPATQTSRSGRDPEASQNQGMPVWRLVSASPESQADSTTPEPSPVETVLRVGSAIVATSLQVIRWAAAALIWVAKTLWTIISRTASALAARRVATPRPSAHPVARPFRAPARRKTPRARAPKDRSDPDEMFLQRLASTVSEAERVNPDRQTLDPPTKVSQS